MRRKYIDYNKVKNGINYRKCYVCNEWFSLNDKHFKVQPSIKGGFSQRCISCQEKYNRDYYINNRDKQIADSKQW